LFALLPSSSARGPTPAGLHGVTVEAPQRCFTRTARSLLVFSLVTRHLARHPDAPSALFALLPSSSARGPTPASLHGVTVEAPQRCFTRTARSLLVFSLVTSSRPTLGDAILCVRPPRFKPLCVALLHYSPFSPPLDIPQVLRSPSSQAPSRSSLSLPSPCLSPCPLLARAESGFSRQLLLHSTFHSKLLNYQAMTLCSP
jgi:hypothetical protein